MIKRFAALMLISLLCGSILIADEKIDSSLNWKFRQEETGQSQLMRLVHQLTDVFGPRLTGSPNFKAACDWAMQEMKQWGMNNVHLEEWRFGHTGWVSEKHIVRVVSPYKASVHSRVVAWTPSTKGRVQAEIVQIDPPENPTEESLVTYLNSVKEKMRGKIVLVGTHSVVPVKFNPSFKRLEESELTSLLDPLKPAAPKFDPAPEKQTDSPKPMSPEEIYERINEFLLSAGALVKVTDAARAHGQISSFANRAYNTSKAVPSIIVQSEDYGRISRLLADGIPVQMEVEIDNTIYADGQNSFNVVAEILGTDKKDQVVMMGAHIDSWHAGTGATDNATGVAAVMEAARILQKLQVKPRRTIRVALWGGEEQGLLGSKAYIRDHFGTFEEPKPEYSNLSAYVNIDAGTGRVRGATVFGPPEAAAILDEILKSFSDLDVVGANFTNKRAYGGTDTTAFNRAGLPGINLRQDPIEYYTHSWHTDLDTYERVLERDLQQCVIVIASVVYHLAMRDEMLPRLTGDSMPPPEKQ